MTRIRYNPQKLIDKLRKMAEGVRKHAAIWPPAEPTPEELEAAAAMVEQAYQTRLQAEGDITKANEVLVEQTLKREGSALGKLQKARAIALILAPQNLGDFGLVKEATDEIVPAALIPTNIRAVEVYDNRAVLSWDGQKVRVAYQVFMAPGQTKDYGDMKMVYSGTQARAIIDGLKPGEKYAFAVRARGKEEPTRFSKIVYVTTLVE